MEHLTQPLELKSLSEDGTFEGIAAAYGNVDHHGDRIEAGTFKHAEGIEIPLLFAHKTDQPIGVATVTDTAAGLLVRGKLLLDTVAGAEAYSRLKAGILKALSVGFQLPKDGFAMKDRVRVISRAVLKEISLVVFPANDRAAVLSVKDQTSPLAGLSQWLSLALLCVMPVAALAQMTVPNAAGSKTPVNIIATAPDFSFVDSGVPMSAVGGAFNSYLAIGDSITYGAYLETLANGYPFQIGSHYGIQPNDQAVSGTTVSSYAPVLYGLTIPQGSRSLITYQLGTNDVTAAGSEIYQQQDYGQGVLSQLAFVAVPSGNRINGASFTYTGTTTAGTYGISHDLAASGATGTFTVTGSTIYLATVMQATYSSAGTASLTCDGTVVSAPMYFAGFGSENIAEGNVPALTRITGLSNSTHTCVVKATSAGTEELLWAAGLSGTAQSNNNVFIGATPDRQTVDANTPNFRPYQSSAAATLTGDGLNVTYVPGTAAAVSKTVGYFNLLHPNALGDYQLAQPYIAAIDSALNLTLFDAPYTGGYIRDNSAGQTNSIVVNGNTPSLSATSTYYNVGIFGFNSGENLATTNNVALFGIGDGANATTAGSLALGGISSGAKITTGSDNVGWGVSDLGAITTQGQNTAIGSGTLNSALGADMSALGYRAGYGNLGFQAFSSTFVTFLGAYTGQTSAGTFTDSTAVGALAVISASHQVQLGSPTTTQVNTSGVYQGTGLIVPPVTIPFSATPVIALASGQLQTITLTGNVTSSTLTGLVAGAHLSLQVCQDATGGHAWTPPPALKGAMAVSTTAGACSDQAFDAYIGTTMDAVNAGATVSAQ